MSNNMSNAISNLLTRAKNRAEQANPEELVYLAKAIQAVAPGEGANFIMQAAEMKAAEIEAAGTAGADAITAESSAKVTAVTDAGNAKLAEVNALATGTFKTVGGESVLGTGDITTGATVAIRKVHNTTNRVSISGQNGTAIPGLEITMPPASANGVWYEINGWSKFDDDNSSTNGGGIAIWAEINGASYWVHKQGSHAEYESGGSDTYRILRTQYLTNGTDWQGFTSGINAGDVIKFRLYAQNHNGADYWNTDNVSEDWGANGYLQVKEISGEVF